MTQQEGEPWAHSEPLAIELAEFTSRTDPLGFTLDSVHNAQAVVVTVELEGLTEIAWDGLVFLPRYAESAWDGNEITLRRLGGWPPGRLAVRVEIVDTFDEALIETTKHVGALGVATLAATGTVATAIRPLIDANHIHVWNCDDLAGSSVLVDSVGGKNLTLQGIAGTDYALSQYVGGSVYPAVQKLLDASTTALAVNATFSSSISQVTFEFVVRFTLAPTATSRSLLSFETVGAAPLDYAYMEYIQYESNTGKIYGAIYNDGPYPSGSFTQTTITTYNSPDIAIVADTTYHAMWTYDSSTGEQKIYIDGVLKNTITGITPTLTNLNRLCLGGIPGSANSPQAYFRDIRISNIVRDGTYAAAAAAALLV